MKANKRLLYVFLASMATLTFCSCRKTCMCHGYDGSSTSYDKTEVKQLADGNCANMKYQSGVRYYSVCEWEN